METNKKVYRLQLKTPKYPGLYLYLVIGDDKKVYANTSRIKGIKQPIPEDEVEKAMVCRLKRFCPGIENDKSIDIGIADLTNLIGAEQVGKLMFSLNGMAQVEKL